MKRRGNGDGCIVKRGGVFYLRKRNPVTGGITNRVLYLKGVKCTTREMAEAAARIDAEEERKLDLLQDKEDVLLAVAKNRGLITALKYSVDDILNEYMASPTRSKNISDTRLAEVKRVTGLFVEWCKGQHLESLMDITQDVVIRYLDEAGENVSARSYNAYREILKSVFGQIWRKTGMPCNPVDGIPMRKMTTQSRKEFTPEQVKAIFDGFDMGFKQGDEIVHFNHEDEFRIVMLLGAFTGCRLKDACLMKWSSIDLDNRTLTYQPQKTAHSSGAVVSIPLHPILHAALVEGYHSKTNDFVVPNLAQKYNDDQSFIIKTIQKIIHLTTGLEITAEKTEGRARGASQYGMHSFRHTFVSFCANAGVPLAVVADIVGHGNPAMTEHYFHASQAVKAQAVEAIQFQGLPAPSSEREQLLEWARTASEDKVRKVLELVKLF